MDLHSEVMNINVKFPELGFEGISPPLAYKIGHRDARHSAAELALKAVARIEVLEEELEESRKSDECFNAVISYILGKGYMESPLEFLRCWNEGNFDALREEWPDAPEEIYLADPLYKEKK